MAPMERRKKRFGAARRVRAPLLFYFFFPSFYSPRPLGILYTREYRSVFARHSPERFAPASPALHVDTRIVKASEAASHFIAPFRRRKRRTRAHARPIARRALARIEPFSFPLPECGAC